MQFIINPEVKVFFGPYFNDRDFFLIDFKVIKDFDFIPGEFIP